MEDIMDRDREEEIRMRAHRIWEQEGKPVGRDAEHWQKAMQELTGRSSSGDAKAREPLNEASASSRAAQDLQSGKSKQRH
jgi:hypothetical protein